MAIIKDIKKEYSALMKKRAAAMRKVKRTTLKQQADFMQTQAIALAPLDTGALITGIRSRRKGKGYQVTSTVHKLFQYNKWTNQTAPYRQPKMSWNKSQPTLYGDGSHVKTGTPRWFHFARLRANEKGPKFASNNTQRMLRVTT